MSMAELPFTEIFKRAIAPARGTRRNSNSRLRQIQAPLAHRTHRVKNSRQNHQDYEKDAKEHFGREHFAHEVKLQNEKNCKR